MNGYNWDQVFREEFVSPRKKFFPLRVEPIFRSFSFLSWEETEGYKSFFLFSSPGQRPGRAIVLPPASASALAAAALANVIVLR